ncbi:MAG: hypothetical protein EP319_02090 [Deltaproteobacteria bacterium]|nr:MAG: hypothetical protein EP319_02090 [Deltaproteobacteria bacterium]
MTFMNKLWLLLGFLMATTLEAGVYHFKTVKNRGEVVSLERQKSGQLTVQFAINSLVTNKAAQRVPYNDGFESLKVQGLETTHKVGAPELPFYSMLLVGHPSEFSFEMIKGSEYKVDVTPAPYQKAPCRCEKDEKEIPFSFDQEAFKNSGKLIQKVVYVGDYRGTPLTHVVFTPFQYRENSLYAYPELRVSIQNKNKSTDTFSFKEVTAKGKKYVIFSPNEFHGALSAFINHKSSQGYEMKLVSMEDLGSDYNSIKKSIHKLYKKENFDYALIVGHEELFPTDYVTTSNDPNTPSDLGYFTMSGNSDNIPDVLYGRMTAASVDDVQNQIAKTIEYETRSWSNSNGMGRMLGIASDEGWNPTDVEYTNQFTSPFQRSFNAEIVNVFQANNDSTPETINRAFNQGLMWVNYIGHGSGPSWISVKSREYDTNDIRSINPGLVKPVIVDVACQNGRFKLDNRLGERFMNTTNNGQPVGAVAFYGGSVDISWHPPAIMARGVSETVAANPNQTLGEVLLAGQMYLIQNYDDRNASTENLKWYHLQGDPSLKLQVR